MSQTTSRTMRHWTKLLVALSVASLAMIDSQAARKRADNGAEAGGGERPTAISEVLFYDQNLNLDATVQPGTAFVAKDTTQLWVVVRYDRRRLSNEPFDQRITFTLPNGNVYQRVTIPVDPAGLGGKIDRTEISPIPISVTPLQRGTPTRVTSPYRKKDPAARFAGFTQSTLPVAGTWITAHGLVGAWTVTVEMIRDGVVVESTVVPLSLD
jgi:hypothetical protein